MLIKCYFFLCTDGLRDLGICRFDHPGLCGLGTNHTSGSRYTWKLNSLSDRIGPLYDADGDVNGNSLTEFSQRSISHSR